MKEGLGEKGKRRGEGSKELKRRREGDMKG